MIEMSLKLITCSSILRSHQDIAAWLKASTFQPGSSLQSKQRGTINVDPAERHNGYTSFQNWHFFFFAGTYSVFVLKVNKKFHIIKQISLGADWPKDREEYKTNVDDFLVDFMLIKYYLLYNQNSKKTCLLLCTTVFTHNDIMTAPKKKMTVADISTLNCRRHIIEYLLSN